MLDCKVRANGVRYPRVGGTRQRRFDGTSLEPKKLPENAATPTRRVHAVLGASCRTRYLYLLSRFLLEPEITTKHSK